MSRWNGKGKGSKRGMKNEDEFNGYEIGKYKYSRNTVDDT